MKTKIHNQLCKINKDIYNNSGVATKHMLLNKFFFEILNSAGINIHDLKYCYWFLRFDSKTNVIKNCFHNLYEARDLLKHKYWYMGKSNWEEIKPK